MNCVIHTRTSRSKLFFWERLSQIIFFFDVIAWVVCWIYYIYVMLNLLKKIDQTRHPTYNCKKSQLSQEHTLDRLHFSTYHVGRTSLNQMHWIVLHQIHWLGYCLTILERMIADDRLGFHKEGRNRLWMKQC